MAGFMSAPFKTLGMLSTAGAFVGGVAKGMNEQLMAEQDLKEQDRKLKAQETIAEYRANAKNYEKNAAAQDYFNDLFGPGTQANKSAMYLFMSGVHIPDIVASMSRNIPGGVSGIDSGGKPGAGSYSKCVTGEPPKSMAEMYQLAINAGFEPGYKAQRAAATAMAESSGRPGIVAVNDGGTGTNSYGLGQINSSHPGAQSALDAQESFRQMYKLSKGGQDWSPWSTNKSQKGKPPAYLQFMPQAQQAANQPPQSAGMPRAEQSSPTGPGVASPGGGNISLPNPNGGADEYTVEPTQDTTQPQGYAEGGDVDATPGIFDQTVPMSDQSVQPMPQAQSQSTPSTPQSQPGINNPSPIPQTMSDACPPTPPQAGQQTAQYVPGTIIPQKQMNPYQQGQLDNAREKTRIECHNSQRQDRTLDFDKDKFYNPMETAFAKSLGAEDGKGYFSMGSQQNAASSIRDADSALTMLADGSLKTSKTQPVWDTLNRFASSLGIDVLANTGIANPVEVQNYLEKIISREQFGEISKYKLGRWTQMEVGMLGRQVASGASDFNTNAKILLLIRGSSAEQAKYIQAVRQAAKYGEKPDLHNAMDVAEQFKASDKPYWAEMHSKDAPQILQGMKPNSWVENLDNHKMFFYKGIQNGKFMLTGDGTQDPQYQIDPQKPGLLAIPVPQGMSYSYTPPSGNASNTPPNKPQGP